MKTWKHENSYLLKVFFFSILVFYFSYFLCYTWKLAGDLFPQKPSIYNNKTWLDLKIIIFLQSILPTIW